MKEKDLDNLERLFRDGLQNMESEPDDAVWQAVQVGVKKPKRFWNFWGIAGMVVIGLVGLMLFQNSEDAQNETLVSNTEQAEMENNPTDGQTKEEPAHISNQLNEPAAASSTPSLDDDAAPGSQVQTQNDDEPGNTSSLPNPMGTPNRKPTQKTATPATPSPTAKEKNPSALTPSPRSPLNNQPTENINPKKEKEVQKTQATEPVKFPTPSVYEIEAKVFPPFACNPQGVSPNTVISKPITQPGLKQQNEEDSSSASRYLLSFGAGTIIPSIHSKGVDGDIRFIKENDGVFGGSFNLGFAYLRPDNWILRTGIEWSSYTNTGLMKYEQTESIKWIDRDRETGVTTREKNYQGQFELKYQWLSIPLEIGHLYPLSPQFNWEWTAGLGLSYLTQYEDLYAALPYLNRTSELNSRYQLGVRLGFGINYQLKPRWALMLNTRYQYQVIPVFKDALLTERHHSLSFRLGVQYTLKSKGK